MLSFSISHPLGFRSSFSMKRWKWKNIGKKGWNKKLLVYGDENWKLLIFRDENCFYENQKYFKMKIF